MIIVQGIEQLQKDVNRLKKKYPSVQADLRYVQRLLGSGKILPQTNPYCGFGQHKMFKTRVYNTSMGNRGKSRGYRVIYEEVGSGTDKTIVLVMLYSKNEYQNEHRIKNEIRFRLNSPSYQALDGITSLSSASQAGSSYLPR